MSLLLRRWRGILATFIIVFLGAETLMLLFNEMPVRLQAARIEHNDSSFSPWLVMKVENPHLSPIKIVGINPEERVPPATSIMSWVQGDSRIADVAGDHWCTATPCIVIPPLSSREVRISHPGNPEGKADDGIWETSIYSVNTSLLSLVGLYETEQMVTASYNPGLTLPTTGDPNAKAAATARNSCCGSSDEEVPSARTEPVLP